jgi:ATP-dependent Clp protease, protease subunit
VRTQGSASDIAIQAKEILRWRARLNELYVKHTQQPLTVIGPCPCAWWDGQCGYAEAPCRWAEATVERDTFMSAAEAVTFGLIDRVLEKRPAPAPAVPPTPSAS